MAAIDTYIEEFLRDAQYRIAQIGGELDDLNDADSPEYLKLSGYRLELYQFMDIIYVGTWSILDGYNHLDWDDYDIKAEAEYLRNRTGMVTSPFTTFVGVYPQIVDSVTGTDLTTGLPAGDPGEFIYYNNNSDPVTVKFPVSAGMADGDTPQTFFS